MGRKGPDIQKINLIKNVLKRNKNGLWVREIARKTGLDKSTVSLYLSKYLKNEIKEIYPSKKGLMKIVRLKNE
jgi:DNA invertase Pin-like site-specific DNA recombinase